MNVVLNSFVKKEVYMIAADDYQIYRISKI